LTELPASKIRGKLYSILEAYNYNTSLSCIAERSIFANNAEIFSELLYKEATQKIANTIFYWICHEPYAFRSVEPRGGSVPFCWNDK